MEETFDEPCEAYYKIFTNREDIGYKYRFLSPFEFKNTLIKYAIKKAGNPSKILNAGRGNPNFLSTLPRRAFSLLNNISNTLAEDASDYVDVGMMPAKKGIATKFHKILYKSRKLPEAKFLKLAVQKMQYLSCMTKEEFIHNLVISCLGSFYPDPPRIQRFAEPLLTEFFDKTIYRPKKSFRNKLDIFPTEGATAGIIYIFNSLKYNGLVIHGDDIEYTNTYLYSIFGNPRRSELRSETNLCKSKRR